MKEGLTFDNFAVEPQKMSFWWKKLRCLLPAAIVFLVIWLAYSMFAASSSQVIDLDKIQGHLMPPNDRSSQLKNQDNKYLNEENAAKQKHVSEDDYYEVNIGDKTERKKEDTDISGTSLPDEEHFYADDDGENRNIVAYKGNNTNEAEEQNSEDEYVEISIEEEVVTTKMPRRFINKNTVKNFDLKTITPVVKYVEFEREPVWRTVSRILHDRGKEREPATPFPDAIPMPRKKSNILLSFSPRPQLQKPLNNPGQGVINADDRYKQTSNSYLYYVMMHSGKASLVHTEMNSNLKYMPDYVPEDAYIFTSKYLPSDPRLRPSVGNGHIATVIHAREVFLSWLYNGRLSESHRAAVPSTCSFNITGTVPPSNFTRYYSLNVGAGIYVETSMSKYYNLTYKVYAHRSLSNLMVVEVDLERSDISKPLALKVDLNRWTASYDLTFRSFDSNKAEVSYKVGTLKATEIADSPDVELHILYDHVPSELVPSSKTLRTKWVFLTAYGASSEEAEQSYNEGLSQIHGKDELFASHVRAWGKLWSRGRVDIKGNLTLARAAYGSWYYLLSSLPLRLDGRFKGLGTSGLPLGDKDKDFQGHVMWDQELWMFPPILLFHSTLSTIILNSRSRLSSTARFNAAQAKLTGLMFPWESGITGVELNSHKVRGALSPFVSAGITFAVQQLLYATNSTAIVKQFGHLVNGIGHFLVSSKLTCKDSLCSVKDVLPFDDSHGVVSNSPFVNDIIRNALLMVSKMDPSSNETISSHWNSFASEIVIPYDETTDLHPAYDFYRKDSLVKEADAVLLGYPLLHSMFRSVRTNDLHYYESVLDPRTSPMTWAMHAIGWLEVGDRLRASAAFNRQLLFIRNEFQVWSNRTLGVQYAANYLPAMGTYLQSLINGYGGVRLRSDRLDFDLTLPDGVTEMNFIGIDYLGSSIDFFVKYDDILVVVTGQLKRARALTLYIHEPEEIHTLKVQQAVQFRRRKMSLFPADAPLPNFPNSDLL